jgi:geranylgeranyl reductase family protein
MVPLREVLAGVALLDPQRLQHQRVEPLGCGAVRHPDRHVIEHPVTVPEHGCAATTAYDRRVECVDVLVVGAGPAGSAAALRLARGGARVLMADRARFPRDKPCGGGVTGRALRHSPCAIDPVVEDVVHTFELRLRYGRSFERRSRRPLILMTQRRRLDEHLAEQAAAAGVRFHDETRVEDVAAENGHVTARVGGRRVRASVVVGADGANGVVAKAAGLGDGIVRGVALEGNAPWDRLSAERYRGRAVVEVGVVGGGYGWLFPKTDHANVGVGGWAAEGPKLRDRLARLAAAYGLPLGALSEIKGHRLPMRRPGSDVASGRILLVGDAAGLVDPLSGDGIYEAFVSARLAADAILAEELDGYQPALAAALDQHLHASWTAKRALDRHPALCFWAARAPRVFDVVAGLLRGDVGHPNDAVGLARPPLRAIARLAR